MYESFALVGLFLLLVGYIAPDEKTRLGFFASLERWQDDSGTPAHNKGSLRWFFAVWIMVFQLLPGRVITTVMAEVVQARICASSKKYRGWISILAAVQAVQTLICIFGILQFYRRFRPELRKHGVPMKLIAFKSIVGIQLSQRVIFTMLLRRGRLHPSQHISYLDLAVGFVPFLTCIEVFLFSVLFLWTFSAAPFGANGGDSRSFPGQENGPLAAVQHEAKLDFTPALLQVLNVGDIVKGTWWRFKLMGELAVHGSHDLNQQYAG